jgi:hypothetical protein
VEFLNSFLQVDESQKVRISTEEWDGVQIYQEVLSVIHLRMLDEARESLNSLEGYSVVNRKTERVLLEDPGYQRRVYMKPIDSLGHLDPHL